METYVADSNKCTVSMRISKADAVRLFALLVWDTRKKGMHGRTLPNHNVVFDIDRNANINLYKWDRLEAAGDVWDIHESADVRPDPAILVLFRNAPGVAFTFVSPMFSVPGFV